MAVTSSSSNSLVQAILQATPDKQLQQALLVGASGESNLNPNASGSGGGGAFGFTPPSYPASDETAPVAQQVAAILPSYQQAQANLPASVTNPAAQAEWIALNAERPGSLQVPGSQYNERSAVIEATDAPTIYGANTSYSVQNWNQIAQITSGSGSAGTSLTSNAMGGGVAGLPDAQSATNTPPGDVGTGILSDCSSYRNSSAATSNCLVGGGGGLLGLPCVLNACQAKALISGAIVFGGAVLMLAAVALLFTDSKAGLITAIGAGARSLAQRTPGAEQVIVHVDSAGNPIKPPTSSSDRSAMGSADNGDFA